VIPEEDIAVPDAKKGLKTTTKLTRHQLAMVSNMTVQVGDVYKRI
jgi:hypothetical protein